MAIGFGGSASARTQHSNTRGGSAVSTPAPVVIQLASSTTKTQSKTFSRTSSHRTTKAPASTTTTTTKPPASTTTTTTKPPASTTTTTTAPPPPVKTSSFGQGAYVGPANPAGIASFAKATGTTPTIASDFLPASSGWAGMDGSGGSLSWLFAQGWTGTPYTLSLGVPIIPTEANGTPDGTLAGGASGAYNAYFVTLAKTLVAAGESGAYLRLGWEFDGNWYAWDAATPADEANYAKYFDQIVTAMRGVSGAAFRFVWNPDASAFDPNQAVNPGYNVSLAWPGAAYVDVIGLDTYDFSWVSPQTPQNAWTYTTAPTLSSAQSFAAAQGKPIGFPEWGAAIRSDGHGLGDDPLYINNMLSWMSTHAVAYESYFDYNTLPVGGDTNAELTGGSFPNSLAAFISDLG